MSSIDDEFASLFLPDLELINYMNTNGGNTYNSGAEKRWEVSLTSPYSIDEMAIGNMENNPSDIYSSNSHWLHHYGKFNNAYELTLNHLQQPYVGFNVQTSQTPHINQSPMIPSQVVEPQEAQEMMTQTSQDQMEAINNGFEAQENELKSNLIEGSFPPVQATTAAVPEQIAEPMQNNTPGYKLEQPLTKNKQVSSFKYAYLLNLSPEKPDESIALYDQHDKRINFNMFGEIDGRFMISESDANESLSAIACYRRNFIQISFNMEMEDKPKFVASQVNGNKKIIAGFKYEIYAKTNFSDNKIDLIVSENKKKSSSGSDITYMEGSVHELLVDKIHSKYREKFALRRTQFRRATPNNYKSTTFQTYYYIVVAVSVVTVGFGEIPLINLKSVPIQVRGRNPSFYNGRNDINIVKEGTNVLHDLERTNNNDINNKPVPNIMIDSNTPIIMEDPTPQPNAVQSIREQLTIETKDGDTETNTPQPTTYNPSSSKSTTPPNYEYFPLSSVYYLPPLDAHYFPHGVHHPRQSSIARYREQSEQQDKKNMGLDHGNDEAGINNRYIRMKLMDLKNVNGRKHI